MRCEQNQKCCQHCEIHCLQMREAAAVWSEWRMGAADTRELVDKGEVQ